MSWLVVPSIVASVAILMIAGVVLFTRPGASRNRWLALALFFVGSLYAWLAVYVEGDERSAAAAWTTLNAGFVCGLAAYLSFFGTMGGPMGRVFALAPVRFAVWAAAALGVALVLGPVGLGEDEASVAVLRYAGIGVWLLGIVVAYSAWRDARSPIQRRRTLAYVVGFGVYDSVNLALQAAYLMGLTRLLPVEVFNVVLLPATGIFLAAALGFGLLRSQLFDIELKLKVGLRRSTLAASFLGVFFVVSQLIQVYAGFALGAVAGAIAAGLLLFALAPLQRAAERIADAALPQVQDTSEYRMVRKREVYRAAVESAMEDGSITDRERSVLATLAQQLGLGPRDAYEIETEARGALRASAPAPG